MNPFETSSVSLNPHTLAGAQCAVEQVAQDPAVMAHISDAKEASSRMHLALCGLTQRLSGLCHEPETPENPVGERPMHGSSEMAQVIRELENSFESAENRLRDLLSRLEI